MSNEKWVSIDKVRVLVKTNTGQDLASEDIYVKKCIECGNKLTAEEASYGHDCE